MVREHNKVLVCSRFQHAGAAVKRVFRSELEERVEDDLRSEPRLPIFQLTETPPTDFLTKKSQP